MTNVEQIDRRRRKVETIDELVIEINTQFRQAQEAEWKTENCRIYAGQLLLGLRERVEAGECGEGVWWWKWYDNHFTRSRRDAERVMAIARSEDPDSAAEAERHACRTPITERAIRLVRRMTSDERKEFVRQMELEYAHE